MVLLPGQGYYMSPLAAAERSVAEDPSHFARPVFAQSLKSGLQTCGFCATSHNSGESCYGLFREPRSTGLQTCGFYATSHNSGELCSGLFREPRSSGSNRYWRPCSLILFRRNTADSAISTAPLAGSSPSSIETQPLKPAPFRIEKILS